MLIFIHQKTKSELLRDAYNKLSQDYEDFCIRGKRLDIAGAVVLIFSALTIFCQVFLT